MITECPSCFENLCHYLCHHEFVLLCWSICVTCQLRQIDKCKASAHHCRREPKMCPRNCQWTPCSCTCVSTCVHEYVVCIRKCVCVWLCPESGVIICIKTWKRVYIQLYKYIPVWASLSQCFSLYSGHAKIRIGILINVRRGRCQLCRCNDRWQQRLNITKFLIQHSRADVKMQQNSFPATIAFLS